MWLRLRVYRFDDLEYKLRRRRWWEFWRRRLPKAFPRNATADGAKCYLPLYDTWSEATLEGLYGAIEIENNPKHDATLH